jgi:hypothetical protein
MTTVSQHVLIYYEHMPRLDAYIVIRQLNRDCVGIQVANSCESLFFGFASLLSFIKNPTLFALYDLRIHICNLQVAILIT